MYNTISNLSTVSNALKSLGLQEDICEDPSKLTESINNLVEEFTKETQDKVEAALSKVNFTTLMYVTADVLTSAIGGIASEWYDKIVNEFWNGKIKGGLVSIMSSILSVVPGAIMFFQYAAVSSLRTNLQYRIKLTRLLKRDLNFLIQILMEYLTLFEDLNDSYDDLDKAINELTIAAKILALEISKSENSKQVISKQAFINANEHIEKSINYLGMGSQQIGERIIDRVHRKYNLKTTPPPFGEQFNPMYWIKYFADLNQEIAISFTGEQGKRTALLIARELFPFFPRFLQLMLLQSRVNQATINLREKTPVITSDKLFKPTIKIFGVKVTKDILGDALEGYYNQALKFFGYEASQEGSVPKFYTDKKTKNLTIQDLNSRIKSFETIILSINTMWEFITAAASPYLALAKTTVNSIMKTRSDMIAFRTSVNHKMDKWNDTYLANKLVWMGELTLAKGYISTATSNYGGFQVPLINKPRVRAISGLQIAEILAESNLIYEDLQNLIISKTIDDKGKRLNEPAEIGYNLSQTALVKLLANVTIVASPKKAISLISELKAIEFTYNEQYALDSVEFNKCNSYISVLENSLLFNDIKISMEYYLENLRKIPTFTEVIDEAMQGNLTKVVQAIGDTTTISDNILNCLGVDTPEISSALKKLDSIAGGTFSWSLKTVEDTLISIKGGIQNTTNFIIEATKSLTDASEYVKNVELINKNQEEGSEIPDGAKVLMALIK